MFDNVEMTKALVGIHRELVHLNEMLAKMYDLQKQTVQISINKGLPDASAIKEIIKSIKGGVNNGS